MSTVARLEHPHEKKKENTVSLHFCISQEALLAVYICGGAKTGSQLLALGLFLMTHTSHHLP